MFEVGQKVVCIKTHSRGIVKEGELHTVKGMKIRKCCGALLLDVGIMAQHNIDTCSCGHREENSDGIYWINSILFRPLDDLFNEEIEELMNEIEELCPA